MNRAEMVELLMEKILLIINNSSDEELAKLLSNNYSIEIKAARTRPIRSNNTATNFKAEDAAKYLSTLTDRLQAGNYLRDTAKNKKNMEQIARSLDIAINRQDKIEDILDKIVEATVGSRLRSAAIRGDQYS